MSGFKVLYSTHASNLTGASRSLLDMLNGLPEGIVKPTVLLRGNGPLLNKLDEMGIHHVTIPSMLSVKGPHSKYPTWAMELVNRLAVTRVTRILRDGEFDIVHSNSLLSDVGMRAARNAELPYVCHVRELVAEDHEMAFCNELRIRDLMASAAMNVFISEVVEGKFLTWIRNAPFVTLFNGIDTENYLLRGHTILEGDSATILLAGRFQPGKGQIDAIKAVEMLHASGRNVTLILIGSIGNKAYFDECKNYISQHHLNEFVEIESFADNLASIRASSDISLTCSRNEAMGRITVEGMLSGCLVIAADSGATPFLLEDGVTGRLYASGDPASLANCITKALDDPVRSRAIAKYSQHWAAKEFDHVAYSQRMIGIYREVLNDRNARN